MDVVRDLHGTGWSVGGPTDCRGVHVQQLGGHIGKIFEKKDVASLQPSESETAELKDHVIIMGFGRVGQTIAQLLSERLIPYVALDVRADRVLAGKAADLPIYFGDAGSPAVLQHVGAARARCAVITLNTPGANYRSVWAVNKNFPHIQIFVRAHDVEHGLNLEKAGATAGTCRAVRATAAGPCSRGKLLAQVQRTATRVVVCMGDAGVWRCSWSHPCMSGGGGHLCIVGALVSCHPCCTVSRTGNPSIA